MPFAPSKARDAPFGSRPMANVSSRDALRGKKTYMVTM